jgi:hypothetical protein
VTGPTPDRVPATTTPVTIPAAAEPITRAGATIPVRVETTQDRVGVTPEAATKEEQYDD